MFKKESRIHAAFGTLYRGSLLAYELLIKSGWMRSRYNMLAMDRYGNPLPWLTYPAIEWLKLNIKPDWRICEYGCGQSTLWFREQKCLLRSVDSDPDWASRIGDVKTCTSRDEYVSFALPIDNLVIIDGNWRNDCARHVVDIKSPMVILDNADVNMCADIILNEAYKHTIQFVGLSAGYVTQQTNLYLEPL